MLYSLGSTINMNKSSPIFSKLIFTIMFVVHNVYIHCVELVHIYNTNIFRVIKVNRPFFCQSMHHIEHLKSKKSKVF